MFFLPWISLTNLKIVEGQEFLSYNFLEKNNISSLQLSSVYFFFFLEWQNWQHKSKRLNLKLELGEEIFILNVLNLKKRTMRSNLWEKCLELHISTKISKNLIEYKIPTYHRATNCSIFSMPIRNASSFINY